MSYNFLESAARRLFPYKSNSHEKIPSPWCERVTDSIHFVTQVDLQDYCFEEKEQKRKSKSGMSYIHPSISSLHAAVFRITIHHPSRYVRIFQAQKQTNSCQTCHYWCHLVLAFSSSSSSSSSFTLSQVVWNNIMKVKLGKKEKNLHKNG